MASIAIMLLALFVSFLVEGVDTAAKIMGTMIAIADISGYSMEKANVRVWWLAPAVVLPLVAAAAVFAALDMAGLNVDRKDVNEYWMVLAGAVVSGLLWIVHRYFR